MASAQSLESDKLSEEVEKEPSDGFVTCSLCKQYNCSINSSENPVHFWLTMDAGERDKHIKHMKNSILAPFLFGKRMNYSSKNITWLKNLRLIPTARSSCSRTCLSDEFIEVADLVEEIVDTVLSCLVSEGFLHNSYHIYKELKDCYFVEDAILIGQKSEFVSLMGHCFDGHHCLDNKRIQLLSLTVLHQAMRHICQTMKPGDYLTKFEEAVKRREKACTELRLQGNSHFAAGEYETAAACYCHAIKFSPFDPLLYGNRAQSYLKLKKLREALSDAKRAVYLKPEWEKGHYRFAQAYFELGFPEKAMAVNSFAQKCCSSTLNLLCQAVVFKREMEQSAERKKPQCSNSHEEQTASNSHQHHQACDIPGTSRTKVGSKRNWKAANQDVTNGAAAIKSSERKDTHNHVPDPRDCSGVGQDGNCNSCSGKNEGSDLELSDDDSIPPLKYDSGDDCNDDDDDDSIPPLIYDSSDDGNDDGDDSVSLWSDISGPSSLPGLASCGESDTESDSEFDGEDEEDMCCSGFECGCCNYSDDDDDNDDEDDDLSRESDDDDDDGGSDEAMHNEDLLRSLMFPPLLNTEVNPLLVLSVIHEFLTAHPEMVNEGSPPALPEVIESLPKIKVTKQQVGAGLSCAVCQCDYEEDETVLELPCSHIFHPQCVITWLKMHATCPTCRDVLPH